MTAGTQTTSVMRAQVSSATAQRLVAEVHAECERRGIRLAAAVVDAGGNLVAAARMDDAQLGALGLATDKAFTAVSFGFPTSAWIQSSAPGGSDWGLGTTLGGRAVVFPGGIPLYHDGQLIGGLGVSGAASTVDEACALAAAAACGLETSA
jgi:glc operon protein GlcG